MIAELPAMKPIVNTLTLENFDKLLNKTILGRGYDYYLDGAVSDVEENKDKWTAEVMGTEIYNVTVSLKKGNEISEYFCGCPYDGHLCKHVAAVFYYLRHEVKERVTKPDKTGKKSQLERLLSKVTTEEFKVFISQYAAKNKDFKVALEIFFADKDDSINIAEKYKSIIKQLVKQASGRGYIDYRSSIGLAKEISKLIGDTYHLLKKNNLTDAFSIACVILKEMMQVITYCDDSSGSIGGVLFETTELFDEMVDSAGVDMQERIFSFLQTELKTMCISGTVISGTIYLALIDLWPLSWVSTLNF